VVTLSFFGNVTHNTDDSAINIGTEVNFTRGGNITVSQINFTGVSPYNISYVYVTAGVGEVAENDLTGVSYFGNSTISTSITGIEIGDEINYTAAGVISIYTMNFSAGTYNISYNYEGTGYVTNSTARTLLSLIIIFFAIAIIIVGYNMVTKSFSDLF